jgi:hypothetical protein
MWRDADGLQIATTVQDGMVRLKREDGQGKPGFSPGGMVKDLEASRASKNSKL